MVPIVNIIHNNIIIQQNPENVATPLYRKALRR